MGLDLATYRALGKTGTVYRKAEKAKRLIRRWLEVCEAPAVSCGGGKDSTALLQLVHSVEPSVPVVCADPPNALPDRDQHIQRLEMADAAPWIRVPYPWDVDGVLYGGEPHPGPIKVKRLNAAYIREGFDGCALGLRGDESKARRINLARRGDLYKRMVDGCWVVTPIIRWSAEEVVGYILAQDVLPLNPVYFKTEFAPPLNHLRDGTWWPHEFSTGENRAWIEHHYPECLKSFDAVLRYYDRGLGIHAQGRARDPFTGIR